MADEARRSRWLQPPAWTTREEIDMSETVTCECGYCRAEERPRFGLCWACEAFIAFNAASGYVRFCAECGARLFFDAAGNPVAEPMVRKSEVYAAAAEADVSMARAAVEWIEDAVANDPTLAEELRDYLADLSSAFAAALAAAEEGAESDGDAT